MYNVQFRAGQPPPGNVFYFCGVREKNDINMLRFLTVLILVIAVTSCDQEIVCTKEFKTIVLRVRDANWNPIALDSAYTIRLGGERINHSMVTAGHYYVLDDAYHFKLKNDRDIFTFYGFRNGTKVIEEVYQISADECDVIKEAGKDEVVL